LADVRAFISEAVTEWRNLHLAELQFWHRSDVRLMLLGLVGLLLVLLIARSAVRRSAGRHYVVLPALPGSIGSSYGHFLLHTPLVLFLLGLGFFSFALADPYTSLIKRDVSFPGR